MIAILENRISGVLQLLLNLGLIAIVETMSLMAKPDPNGHGQAKCMGSVENLSCAFGAPGTNRVAPDQGQLLQRTIATRAADQIGRTTAQQLPTILSFP